MGNHKVMIVSDGLYYPELQAGTAAWIITIDSTNNNFIFRDNITPRDKQNHYSH